MIDTLKRLFISKRTYIVLFLLAISIGLFELYTSGALSSKRENTSGIRSLVFEWTDTIFETGSIQFQREANDSLQAVFHIHGLGMQETDKSGSFDASSLTNLEAILQENQVHLWNGFNKHFWPIRILDYDAFFTLTIQYQDGGSVKASGYMHFPEGYKAFQADTADYVYSLFKNQKQ